MSARERSRYVTTVVVFLLAFAALGALLVRSMAALAQDFTFRPSAASSNTYAGGTASTQRLGFAFDTNLNTAATTYTNADFGGDGATPDTEFTFSGRWSVFQQTTTFLRDVGLYVLRQGTGNVANQWRIEYSITGLGGTYHVLDSDTLSGANPSKGLVGTMTIPDDLDLETQLFVRTTSQQLGTNDAALDVYDIRVEADFDTDNGGPYQLTILTDPVLPDGVRNVTYPGASLEAGGGNQDYYWCLISGALPAGLSFSPSLPSCSSSSVMTNSPIDIAGTPTAPGDYAFTARVTDSSSPSQLAQQQFNLHIVGLAISPAGPSLPSWNPVVKNESGSQTFSAVGGASPYTWCLVSGSIPPGLSFTPSVPTCPSTATASSVTLSGTPTDAGVYSFTLKLADSGGETPAQHSYVVNVSSSGVTILDRILKPVVKGINYGTALLDMTPQYLQAINVVYSTYATDVTWSATGLPTGFSLQGKTFNTTTHASSVYLGGTIGVGEESRVYNFTASVDDGGSDSDGNEFQLSVLDRKTLLLKGPAAAAVLPSGNQLNFTVSAEGGAPGETSLAGKSVPYYNYAWLVTPVGNTPVLDTADDTGDTPAPGPSQIPITFESGGEPVTGTYDVTFWAQDQLVRDNPPDVGGSPANHPWDTDTNDEYEFTPVTVRITVVAPAGQTLEKDTGRPTILKQEQFR